MENKYFTEKKKRKENKRKTKRNATAEEVIFIFEKIIEGWKTIRIYNTIIQNNSNSTVLKKNVENISTGNSKVYPTELPEDRYKYYLDLRDKVYQLHIDKKNEKNKSKISIFSNVNNLDNINNLYNIDNTNNII
jgi:hypothetical protein